MLIKNDRSIITILCRRKSCKTSTSILQFLYILAGGSFTTVITAWPDVEDNSVPASVFRVIIYVGWLLFMSRVAASRILLIMTTVLLSHQYKNLRSYFYSLDSIFQGDTVDISHKEKELKYVQALKVGFKLHSDTLW